MSKANAARVQKHRALLRASGLRPIQIWVADARKKGFLDECRRQSKIIKNDSLEMNTLKWINFISDVEGWI